MFVYERSKPFLYAGLVLILTCGGFFIIDDGIESGLKQENIIQISVGNSELEQNTINADKGRAAIVQEVNWQAETKVAAASPPFKMI